MIALERRGRRGRQRAGVAAVLAIGCLFVVLLLAGALVRTLHVQQALLRQERLRAQADWLASAGLVRARAQLAANPQYTGEIWNVTADDLGAPHAGQVRIELDAAEGRRQFRATAQYPADRPLYARVTLHAPREAVP